MRSEFTCHKIPEKGKRTFCFKCQATTEDLVICLLTICHLRIRRYSVSINPRADRLSHVSNKDLLSTPDAGWTAVSPGDELADVGGEPVQPLRGGEGEGEGVDGRGWPGDVGWAILPEGTGHAIPPETKRVKTPTCNLQLTGPCHRTSCSIQSPCVWALLPSPCPSPWSPAPFIYFPATGGARTSRESG